MYKTEYARIAKAFADLCPNFNVNDIHKLMTSQFKQDLLGKATALTSEASKIIESKKSQSMLQTANNLIEITMCLEYEAYRDIIIEHLPTSLE